MWEAAVDSPDFVDTVFDANRSDLTVEDGGAERLQLSKHSQKNLEVAASGHEYIVSLYPEGQKFGSHLDRHGKARRGLRRGAPDFTDATKREHKPNPTIVAVHKRLPKCHGTVRMYSEERDGDVRIEGDRVQDRPIRSS
ncbi:MAG: hypothetical protein WD557_15630 [Dehalococcoidia bacterium]